MRSPFALAIVVALQAVASEASASPESAILTEMRCTKEPRAAVRLAELYAAGLIRLKPTAVFDSVNVFVLRRPLNIDGLNIVAVFGYDVMDNFPLVRSPGTAPGVQFGVVSKESLWQVERWRGRINPSLSMDDGNSGVPGGKEIACRASSMRP